MTDLSTIAKLLDGVRWKHSGNLVALCPFHDDHDPSLLVNSERYKCLGCGAGGRTKNLPDRLRGLPTKRWQGKKRKSQSRPFFNFPREIEPQEALAMNAHADLISWSSYYSGYLRKRGLVERIEPQMLGWYKGWITIPVFDELHGYQGMVLRATSEVQDKLNFRYYIPPDQPALMYCPDWRLLKKHNSVFLVYGVLDALTLCDLRMPVVSPTAGAASFKAEWLKEYRKKVYVLPDAEPAVEWELAKKLVSDLDWRGDVVKLKYPKGAKDANDFFTMGRRQALLNQLTKYL